MSLKDPFSERQQTHEKGYFSLTEEELNEAKINHQINAEVAKDATDKVQEK